ncbi:hypothetical protein [Pandoraea sp. NPDC087047]|uniref:hypothetical protein n=1 Tax=Pandoraea sp. NPDC087047 TaxID=3364390 RepID=UPI0037F1DBA0
MILSHPPVQSTPSTTVGTANTYPIPNDPRSRGADDAQMQIDAAKALNTLAAHSGSHRHLVPSPPTVGRFAALMHHVGNTAFSLSALGTASLSTIKETYESSTLSSAHKITLTTASFASLSSLMDLAVAVGKYCNPSSTPSHIMNTSWVASAGQLLGSKHLETYGGKYQSTLLGASMMVFFNQAGRISGGHEAKQERGDDVTPSPFENLAAPTPSVAPDSLTHDLDALQSCIGFTAAAYRAFGSMATIGVIEWMNAKEAKRNMDVIERSLNYEESFGTPGVFRPRDADIDIEASDDSGVDDASLNSVAASVPQVTYV